MNKAKISALIISASLFVCTVTAAQETADSAPAAVDNGTDPTKFLTIAEAKYEYLDLNGGFGSSTLRLSYTQPFGGERWNIRARLPVAAVDIFGNDSYNIGDFSLEVAHVFGLSEKGAFVAKGEMVFDTAQRPELGTGQNVFKGTFIYAKFLKGGNIFAPAVVQSNSLWGDDNRADVNSTTFDFYYVPKLRNPKNLITYDPALNFDWENDKQFASLAITFGRVLGPQFGGNGILFFKPSVFAGDDKPSAWGMEVGYKVLGF
jgi:hypothetical protein